MTVDFICESIKTIAGVEFVVAAIFDLLRFFHFVSHPDPQHEAVTMHTVLQLEAATSQAQSREQANRSNQRRDILNLSHPVETKAQRSWP